MIGKTYRRILRHSNLRYSNEYSKNWWQQTVIFASNKKFQHASVGSINRGEDQDAMDSLANWYHRSAKFNSWSNCQLSIQISSSACQSDGVKGKNVLDLYQQWYITNSNDIATIPRHPFLTININLSYCIVYAIVLSAWQVGINYNIY